jgi:hypothetical protein
MIGSFLDPDLAERFQLVGVLVVLIAVLLTVSQFRKRAAARRAQGPPPAAAPAERGSDADPTARRTVP